MDHAALPVCSKLPIATGIGLRAAHHERLSAEPPAIAWLEVHTENFLGGGATPALLQSLRERYAISLHGVGLSLGSADGLDREHLARIAALVRRIEPAAISDHVSWSVTGGVYFNDLLPIPYDDEALDVIARNVAQFQDAVGRPVMVENPSTYLRHAQSDQAEPQFLAELCRRSGCGLLLDVNNVYVSAFNHGFDPKAYLDAIDPSRVTQYHLAGHTNKGTHIIDTHDDHAIPEVWDLYRHSVARTGNVSTLFEWDGNIPAFEVVHAEALQARKFRNPEEGRVAAAS